MTYDEAVKGIGELVIGNKLADKYWTTRAGTIWRLIGISDEDELMIKIIQKDGFGITFEVDMECFDFVSRPYGNYNSRGRANNY